MEKRLLLLSVVLVVLRSSVAFAPDPMGPPVAGLKEGQFSAGLEYSWSEMNIKAIHGQYTGGGPSGQGTFDITDMEMNKFYGNIGYGISDKWEAFLRLGVASDDGDIEGVWDDPYPGKFNAGSAFAIGCGTKMTLHESSPNLKWGALAQFSSTRPDGKVKTDYPIVGDLELKFIEVQFAVGPTYQVSQGIWVYGGPFIHFVDGEMRVHQTSEEGSPSDEKAHYNLEEQTNFGGYVGAQVDVMENVPFYIEWQHTDDADAIATGVTWKF